MRKSDPSRLTYVLYDDDDEEFEVSVPAIYEICSRCAGHGKHVNPNVDGHGITSDEWERDWDDESREMYFSGGYDVRCEEGCEDGKVLVPDLSGVSADVKEKIERHLEDVDRWDREDRHIRRMESGGWG